MNRRGLLGFLAGAPVAGAAVGQNILAHASMPPSTPYPMGSLGMNSPGQLVPDVPLMQHANAMRLILGDKNALAAIRDELMANNRDITSVDSDIMAMRSWSLMAKIAFQRQRNVDRAIEDLQEQRWNRPGHYIRAIEDRLSKLMWGK